MPAHGKSSANHRAALRRAYRLMRARFGHLGWWPGDTPFEICVGAILTQNTSWTNVERAIANLKAAGALEPRALFALPETRLAQLLRPAGYFNVKARRLRSFLHVIVEDFGGDLARLFAGPTPAVRERLLAINGIGPETADSMLLYAGGHHSFVIDAYTRRVFERHGWKESPKFKVQGSRFKVGGRKSRARNSKPARADNGLSYDELKALCERELNKKPAGDRLDYWQDYHAQLVMVGKHYCRTRQPRCDGCPLKTLLPRRADDPTR